MASSGVPSLEPRGRRMPGGEPKRRPRAPPRGRRVPRRDWDSGPCACCRWWGMSGMAVRMSDMAGGEVRACGACGCRRLMGGVRWVGGASWGGDGGLVREAAVEGMGAARVRCPLGGLGCGGVRASPSARMWWLSGRRFVECRRPLPPFPGRVMRGSVLGSCRGRRRFGRRRRGGRDVASAASAVACCGGRCGGSGYVEFATAMESVALKRGCVAEVGGERKRCERWRGCRDPR
jgi:hypothetical protein